MNSGLLTEVEPLPGRVSGQERLRVLLANRHVMLLEGLVSAVSTAAGIELVGATASVAEAAELVGRCAPDVAVLGLDEAADVELARQIRRSNEALAIVLLASELGQPARRAVDAGCSVLVTRGRSTKDLIGAIRSAGRGDLIVPLEVVAQRSPARIGGKSCLTSRELEVLRLLADGVSTRQIASFLTLSCHTVRNHINNIMAKLGVHSRLEAVIAGQRLGLLERDRTIP